MADYPYMPFFFDAYMLDCAHLTDAEHGRYLLIMKELWLAPSNRIPNDVKWIARRFRRSVEEAESEVIPLLREFCKTDGNWWWQKRICEEFERASKNSKSRSASAKARWKKEKVPCERNANAMLSTPTSTTKESESYPRDSESVSRDGVGDDDAPALPVAVCPGQDGVSGETVLALIERMAPRAVPERTVRREIAVWVRSLRSPEETERIILSGLRRANDPMAYACRIVGRQSADLVEAIERGRRGEDSMASMMAPANRLGINDLEEYCDAVPLLN